MQSNASQLLIESGWEDHVEFRFGRGQHPFDFITPLWVLLDNVQMLMPKCPGEPQGQIASFDLFEGWVGSIVWVVKPTFGPGLNVLNGIEAFIINLGSFLFCEWSLGFIDLL